jgi:transcriptional regulator with XRE-family HTH domain
MGVLREVAEWDNADDVRAHIRWLLNGGMTAQAIEEAAHLAPSDVTVIMHGTTGKPEPRRILRAKAQRIYAVGLDPALAAPGGEFGFRCQRRVQALARRGWRQEAIAGASGLHESTIADVARGFGRISRPVLHLLDGCYQANKFTYGDSLIAHDRAVLAQFAPAEAWPGDSIDDFGAAPNWVLVRPEVIQRELELRVARMQLEALRAGQLRTKRVLARLVRAHLQWLGSQGMPLSAVRRATGRPRDQLLLLLKPEMSGKRQKWVDGETALAILAVGYEPSATTRGVLAVPSRRRIQSMQWMKWRLREIANGSSVSYATVVGISSGAQSVDVRTHEAIRLFCDANRDKEGLARKRANFPPFEAWDVSSIDDPSAAPDLLAAVRGKPALGETVLEHLQRAAKHSENPRDLLVSLGVPEGQVATMMLVLGYIEP